MHPSVSGRTPRCTSHKIYIYYGERYRIVHECRAAFNFLPGGLREGEDTMSKIVRNGRTYFVVRGVVYMSRETALEALNGSR